MRNKKNKWIESDHLLCRDGWVNESGPFDGEKIYLLEVGDQIGFPS